MTSALAGLVLTLEIVKVTRSDLITGTFFFFRPFRPLGFSLELDSYSLWVVS
jgi:hypothetical protein